MRQDLNGRWEFRECGKTDWKPASVPGCNYLDLMALGDIPDPFDGLNELNTRRVGEKDWEYRRKFCASEENISADKIILCCKRLDTICEIRLNGQLVGSGQNCHIAYEFDMKPYIRSGENEISIVFRSPVKYVESIYKKESAPMNSNGQNGIVHIRKPQYHFGWDWGPALPPSGIAGDIFIDYVSFARILDLKIRQTHAQNGVTVYADAAIEEYRSDNLQFELSLTFPDGKTVKKQGRSAEFIVEHPLLWQTFELSGKAEQPMYEVMFSVKKDGETIARKSKKIGLRTIELNRDADEFGQNFQFRLNGVPLFIKGSNYIPPDSFMTRFDSSRLNKLLDAVQFSNINMLRIWGGGYYESDEFYEECDRRGILVWQDFCFACQAYPFFKPDFLENVKREIKYNVKRLSHHPCLAVWCGNNEIEDMSISWIHMRKYIKWTEKFFYNILESEVRKYDPSTPYTPGSPCGIYHGKGVGCDNVGDTHLWGVWHGLQPMNHYRKRMTRFCSEFGFESLPDIKTIERFAEPKDYSLSSDVFKAHQKCANGNDKMIYYIASRFNLPKKFEDYIYLSQVTQQECIADATEHWRRNKGRCNGSMYWQFNDCWPVCSWSSYDYFGCYKALQYTARNVNAPLSVSIEDSETDIKIYALNDYNEQTPIEAEYLIFDFENGIIKSEKKCFQIDPLENRVLFAMSMKSFDFNLLKTGICVRLYQDSKLLMQKTYLFDKEKNLQLPKSGIKKEINFDGNKLIIKLSADGYARLVKIESSKSMLPFSDNYFDILPGEEKTVTMTVDASLSVEEQINSISVMSCCDIEYETSRIKNHIARMKVWFSPMNIVNCLYHRRKPKDLKIK